MMSILSELGWPNVAMLLIVGGIVLYATWRRGWHYRRDSRGGKHLMRRR
jgi:hypothetical protein